MNASLVSPPDSSSGFNHAARWLLQTCSGTRLERSRVVKRLWRGWFRPFLLRTRPETWLSMMGSGEQFETEVLLARLPSTGVAVDLGANVGYYTILAARKVGAAGRVYAFEPDPENYRGLRTVVRAFGYGHVVLEDCAVSDRAGHARLYLSETNSGDHRIFDPGDGRRSVDVSTTSLDGYFAARGSIPRIDVVKMDIQGAEVAALRGMRQVIAANPLLILLTEFWPRGLLAAGSSAQEHLALLGELGLDFRRINEESRSLECVSVERLLETHTVEAGNYTNLICGRPEVLEP